MSSFPKPVVAPTAPAASAAGRLNWQLWVPIALFAVLWVDLIRQLAYTWETREQYSYGWFVPLFALYFGWRRWTDRPTAKQLRNPALASLAAIVALGLLPLRVIFEINADWALISWAYALSIVGLTLYAVWMAGGWPWVRHFCFPIAFILVAVEWPYRIEKRLTQDLMQVIASLTVEILEVGNIPALQRGNLIEVGTGVVGVDEACSGIRSLHSTLMGALLMGELYRLGSRSRLVLLTCGLVLAFIFNLIRTLFLSWQASKQGLKAIDRWHDSAGIVITVACFAGLWLLAVRMRSRIRCGAPPGEVPVHGPLSAGVLRYLCCIGCLGVGALLATEVWYRSHDIKGGVGQFEWTATFPTNSPSYTPIELPPRTAALINADIMRSGKWLGPDSSEWSVFFFRWNPASIYAVLRARIHRPDRCLPASGFHQVADDGIRFFETAELRLPFRRYTYERDGGRIHVFFCQWEDGGGKQAGLQSSSHTGRLQAVLTGRRKLGQQTMELILTGCASQQQADALVAANLSEFVKWAAPPPRRDR